MTLTFSEQTRDPTRIKRAFLVTLDGSITTIDASSLDMHYIDSALITGVSIASDIAPTLCTGAGTSIVLGKTHANGDQINLWVWGY